MVREDLISSAVSFLQDPSVIGSSLDKRIAFLQSKNLTQEEIDVALARAGDSSSQATTVPPSLPSHGYPNQQMIRQPNGYGYGYGPYPNSPWSQPIEPPRRDWRDYFIVATLTSTLGYTLYALSRRYILPLISPPTPPQLESDKASIDASFARAFALIDHLAADTSEIKRSEEERTNKVDTSLDAVNKVVEDLKDGHKKRETENRMIADQVHSLRDLVPKALEGWKTQSDSRLEELREEVKSLKKLLATRVGSPTTNPSSSSNVNNQNLQPQSSSSTSTSPSRANANVLRNLSNPAPPNFERDALERRASGTVDAIGLGGKVAAGKASYEGSEMGDKMASVRWEGNTGGSGLARGGKAAIPAWQMAAAGGKGDGSGSGSGSGEGSAT
ncbi:MAG: hypothetical protein LQ339_003069 [Xanthoria mediterranea]|nr:MAG: hypothetical protein LQ339_003069 [Xanthoria mediterranea]